MNCSFPSLPPPPQTPMGALGIGNQVICLPPTAAAAAISQFSLTPVPFMADSQP